MEEGAAPHSQWRLLAHLLSAPLMGRRTRGDGQAEGHVDPHSSVWAARVWLLLEDMKIAGNGATGTREAGCGQVRAQRKAGGEGGQWE